MAELSLDRVTHLTEKQNARSHVSKEKWKVGRCVSKLFVAMTEMHDKNNMEEERLVLAHVFRGLIP